jgi:hypothetical protein
MTLNVTPGGQGGQFVTPNLVLGRAMVASFLRDFNPACIPKHLEVSLHRSLVTFGVDSEASD